MGFGYYVAETALGRPLPLSRLAWLGCNGGSRDERSVSVAQTVKGLSPWVKRDGPGGLDWP